MMLTAIGNNERGCFMNFGCIVVTFNRLDKLKLCLAKYAEEIFKPKYILVVNNASTDGTTEYLSEWEKIPEGFDKLVLNLSENIGGSGGFYTGFKESLNLDAEWIMVADDDAYPEKGMFANLAKVLNSVDPMTTAIVSTSVIQHGVIGSEHRRNIIQQGFDVIDTPVSASEYEKDYFICNATSYVGSVINKHFLKQVGLPRKDYFIWYDDTEHTLRLSRVGKSICIPKLKMIHLSDEGHYGLSWKTYYGRRNRLDCFNRLFPKGKYYRYFVFLGKAIFCPLIGKSFVESKVRLAAFYDAYKGNFGIHAVYRPGWKP